uniref:Rho GTPase activating protein 15 n=1 Tax=Leptobrachium leishanense TaxID=445787 RepID=A0A8C5MFR0_9ANUR
IIFQQQFAYVKFSPQITTPSGNEFLLQSDEDFAVLEWFRAIKNAIDSLGVEQQISKLSLNIRKSASSELLHLRSEAKEQKSEQRKSAIFKLNYSASDTCDRNHVKSRLKKFISRRPSLKTLQEKGLIKGLDADGIYRVSGNLATIQKLRFVVNQEEKLNLDDSQWEDIHVVTGALKMFFRELPEPLFPYCFFEQFVEAIKIQDNDQRVKDIRILVKKLSPSNRDTMRALFEHLKRIVENASVNLMSTQSLGIVFGPTLLATQNDTENMAVWMVYQSQIVELMVMESERIFHKN